MFSAEQYRALHEGAGLRRRSDRGRLRFTRRRSHELPPGPPHQRHRGADAGSRLLRGAAHGPGADDRRHAGLRARRRDCCSIVAGAPGGVVRDRFDQFDLQRGRPGRGRPGGHAAARRLRSGARARGRVAARSARDAAAALDALPLHATTGLRFRPAADDRRRSDDIGVGGLRPVRAGAPRPPAAAIAARGRGDRRRRRDGARSRGSRPGGRVFGVDMDEDTIPLEAGIEDRAISLTKGCYVGQEIIIRVLHRGHGRVAQAARRPDVRPGAAVPAQRRRHPRGRSTGRQRDQRGVLAGARAADRARLRASRFRRARTTCSVTVHQRRPVGAVTRGRRSTALPLRRFGKRIRRLTPSPIMPSRRYSGSASAHRSSAMSSASAGGNSSAVELARAPSASPGRAAAAARSSSSQRKKCSSTMPVGVRVADAGRSRRRLGRASPSSSTNLALQAGLERLVRLALAARETPSSPRGGRREAGGSRGSGRRAR